MKDKRRNRRHHYYRLKNRALEIMRVSWGFTTHEANKVVGKYVDNMKPCSCSACGNPRKKFEKPTIQEAKSEIDFKEQINEVGNI